MTGRNPSNIPASIHQRLLNLRDESGENFNLLLTQYVLERLLYRLSKSQYADQFILKGALLFVAWTRHFHRPTRDLDLLGYGDASSERIRSLFQHICETEGAPDGLIFDPESITVREIRENQEYESQRVHLTAHLGNARVQVQIDLGFGDVVTPAAQIIHYPTLFDFPEPRIRAYPPETVIAEKLQAMVALGIQNSRMKDFYDLWLMAHKLSFDGATLVEAIRATFNRRKTKIPDDTPIAFSDVFVKEKNKAIQWQAFLRRNGLEDASGELSEITKFLHSFLMPPLLAASRGEPFRKSWKNSGHWL